MCPVIEEMAGGTKSIVTRGCSALQVETDYKCEVHQSGAWDGAYVSITNSSDLDGHQRFINVLPASLQTFTMCNCHGDECNKDWETASPPAISCYACESGEGGCSDTETGPQVECPINMRRGCYISKCKSTVIERKHQ